ncbi:signal peptidase I [Streptomyces sp. LX-29]|uniref:signal peptidase I n=1 Tax=Streptomyces sp. LX-29 TaxID=2900152 RepID=UPI00240E11C8|nr:signal peptidase I [Streptomyces sp. LX-29]WFB07170.1 signal peptidase I [Streptomyces sp. LX-29]
MSGARSTDGGGRTRGSVLSGVAVALGCVLFLGGFAWGALLYKPYTVPTNSMAPSIKQGARVLAERIDGDEVRRGDVVVFQDKVWGNTPMVKRVVGVDGDKVECCDRRGRLMVNGKPIEEPYLPDTKATSTSSFFSATVPKDELFLLGDHRVDSVDSPEHLADGAHGTVPRDTVQARVDAVVWPQDAMGMLERPTGFAALPGGISEPGPVTPLTYAVTIGAVLILGGAAYGPIAKIVARRREKGERKAATVGG